MNKAILNAAEMAGFVLKDSGNSIDWASEYDDALEKFALICNAMDKSHVLLCERCAKDIGAINED